MTKEGEPAETKGPSDRLNVIDHQSGREKERVEHIGMPAPSLIEVDERVASFKQPKVRPQALEVEPWAAVEYYDRIRAASLHPIEDAQAICSRNVPTGGSW